SRRRHTRLVSDWSSDVCSSDLEQIQQTLTAANANRPKGELSDGQRTWQLATTDQLFTAAQYKPLIVAYKNGSPIRLSDIATVERSEERRVGKEGRSRGAR